MLGSTGGEREDGFLLQNLLGIEQRRLDVLGLEAGVLAENLRLGDPLSHQLENKIHRDSGSRDNRLTGQNPRVEPDALKEPCFYYLGHSVVKSIPVNLPLFKVSSSPIRRWRLFSVYNAGYELAMRSR